MTQIDYDGNGTPDGIINLYEEYTNTTGNTLQAGTWFDPDYNFAINGATGDLLLWDLDNSTEDPMAYYEFQLFNANCGSTIPAITIQLQLGPFEGNPLPPSGVNDASVTVCEAGVGTFDLFQVFESLPSPHMNGVWAYIGNMGDPNNFIFLSQEGFFIAQIPYEPGGDLIDFDVFEFSYTVPGIAPCNTSVTANFKVEVIRDIQSGLASDSNICETDLIAGVYDTDIDLTDNQYLLDEDIEGTWSSDTDPTNQISSLGDSVINLGEVYDYLYQTNQRFGCETFLYDYSVETRATLFQCEDKMSSVSFTFLEAIRPFSQNNRDNEFCLNTTQSRTISLYDYLEFTNENGVTYDYPNVNGTNWELVSGPSNLGIQSNTGHMPPSAGVINWNLAFIPSFGYTTPYRASGLINLDNAQPGRYVFRYSVLPSYNCSEIPDLCTNSVVNCQHPCTPETADITIIIHPINYAGEDTGVLEFCESDLTGTLDLIALLETNDVESVYVGDQGIWTDLNTGNIITNPFTLPEINNEATFNFNYTTTTSNNCEDTANLSFTVYEQYQSLMGSDIEVCNDDDDFNLFNILTGPRNTTGVWSGPEGFTSTTHNVTFDPETFIAGDYTYTVPDNGLCLGNAATIGVTIFQNGNAGDNVLVSACRISDMPLDLFDVIDPSATSGGIFVDLNATGSLEGSLLELSELIAGTYNFEYQVQGNAICRVSTSQIALTIIEVDPPVVDNQSFCISEGATLSDIQISNATDFNWYDSATSTTILDSYTVLGNNEDYYLAAVDGNGCESERVQTVITLVPFGSQNCADCISDGVSVNQDSQNDVLDLCNLPEVFPNYIINIFNRYGANVFTGNNNTSLFSGNSNVSLTLGDALSSGVYYYIFTPNDNVTAPFQGHFYLSR